MVKYITLLMTRYPAKLKSRLHRKDVASHLLCNAFLMMRFDQSRDQSLISAALLLIDQASSVLQ